jgi:RimJ/RimL family protein N-acetyltransferase
VRHELVVEGHGFRLRPVAEDDAAFIVALRAARADFLNPGATSVSDQLDWLVRYFARPGDYYFVIEARASACREGLVGIYDIDAAGRTGEWGRWVVQAGSSAAVESALLVYRCAFEVLRLQAIRCRTLLHNAQVVAFHDSCGLRRAPLLARLDGDAGDAARTAVEHVLDAADWPALEALLEPLAARAARAPRTACAP